MAGQRERIGHQLHSLYTSGEQSPLRLLLNQSHAESVSRHLRYYDYLLSARREDMSGYLNALQQKRELEAQIRLSVLALQDMQAVSEKEQAALLGLRDERRQLLAGLSADLEAKSDELKQLERDRAALQNVIDQIEQQRALAFALEQERQERALKEQQLREQQEKARQAALAPDAQTEEPVSAKETSTSVEGLQTPAAQEPSSISTSTVSVSVADKPASLYSAEDLARLQSTSFQQRKGKMAWPVKGSLVNRFGEQRKGSVTWEGMRIRAQAGAEVHAVHYGRVVYADWLRGQGMLIILDHGDGYMSLYAHNDVLLREQGEWVQAGDVIARVGNSGGERESGLYFEIRQSGKTVDPGLWLGK